MTYRRGRRSPTRFGVAAAALVTAACGNLTAGGVGEASVFVSGDVAEPAPVSSFAASLGGPLSGPARTSQDEPEGEIEMVFTLHLVADGGELVQLGASDLAASVDVGGDVEAPAVQSQPITARRYTELRVTFSEFEVEIDSGLVIGGDTITGPIEVEFDDGALQVARPLDLDVSDGSSVEFVVDLNAPSWLQVVDPVTLTINEAEVAALVVVSVR